VAELETDLAAAAAAGAPVDVAAAMCNLALQARAAVLCRSLPCFAVLCCALLSVAALRLYSRRGGRRRVAALRCACCSRAAPAPAGGLALRRLTPAPPPRAAAPRRQVIGEAAFGVKFDVQERDAAGNITENGLVAAAKYVLENTAKGGRREGLG
jgi:hypothetical protein